MLQLLIHAAPPLLKHRWLETWFQSFSIPLVLSCTG